MKRFGLNLIEVYNNMRDQYEEEGIRGYIDYSTFVDKLEAGDFRIERSAWSDFLVMEVE